VETGIGDGAGHHGAHEPGKAGVAGEKAEQGTPLFSSRRNELSGLHAEHWTDEQRLGQRRKQTDVRDCATDAALGLRRNDPGEPIEDRR
jgi:hypothetical protein